MERNKPKLLILGHAKHGKDEVAKMIAEIMDLNYVPTSPFMCEKAIYPQWGRFNYMTIGDMIADGEKYRSTWFDLVKAYNTPNASRLAKELLNDRGVDMYVGMRREVEIKACAEQKVFTHVLWVDASKRLPKESGDSMEADITMSDYTIDNNLSLNELRNVILGLQKSLNEQGYSVGITKKDKEKLAYPAMIRGNVHSLLEHPQMQAEVILASQGPYSPPIYTVRMRYPRCIHGEIMTHRVFSRNARSSRAVPVKTMLNEVRNMPYVPWHWGKNQKGMQASEECNELLQFSNTGGKHFEMTREEGWLAARDAAVAMAEAFMEAGYHKQNPNRLLEPFSWMDTLITSTDWNNFFWLRQHKDAEPHLQDLANLVYYAIENAEVQTLMIDEWHLPYITNEDWLAADSGVKPNGMTTDDFLLQVSAARSARISYKPFNGDASYKGELDRYESLVTSERVHASPLEHQAKPDRKHGDKAWENDHLHGNLYGWIQARKLVPNEAYTS